VLGAWCFGAGQAAGDDSTRLNSIATSPWTEGLCDAGSLGSENDKEGAADDQTASIASGSSIEMTYQIAEGGGGW